MKYENNCTFSNNALNFGPHFATVFTVKLNSLFVDCILKCQYIFNDHALNVLTINLNQSLKCLSVT